MDDCADVSWPWAPVQCPGITRRDVFAGHDPIVPILLMKQLTSELKWGRVFLIGVAFFGVYFVGQYIAEMIVQRFDLVMHVRSEPMFHRLIMTASAIYTALLAVPFMPGAEVGISMILLFGSKICFLVYVCTVAALIPPYLIGRLIPASYCVRALEFIGLSRAQRLVERIALLSAHQRLDYLLDNAPTRMGPFLIRHRFVALAIVLNMPGNIVIGGGGGIAMIAGMSGLYTWPRYLLTVAVAVAPIPLIISLTEPWQ